ncbi:MAG: alcohol dehydrogenase catalytic domain-containing protein [Syntrophales bacterium]|nr:alcohol dehydrogenase catalytic domain-containing protein [Syntrophales bacterium]
MLPNKMNALVFKLNIPKYLATKALSHFGLKKYSAKIGCLSLKNKSVPELPSEDWVIVRTLACGICGTDLATLTGKESFSMEPYSSFPAVMGHEAIGQIVKLGRGVTEFEEYNRVAVDSVLPCITRSIEPPCPYCINGNYALCENFTKGSLSAGPVNGYNSSVGGGFAQYFPAHKSQLFLIPTEMQVKEAVLIDPLASSLQPVAANFPGDRDTVIVYGGGIIGILLINSLKALKSKAKIIAVVKYDFQEVYAKEAGADYVIRNNLFKEFARITHATIMKTTLGKPAFEGGVDIVFDCVGSAETIDNSLRFLRKRGKLVIVGSAGSLKKIDATPIWFKELRVTGSAMYSNVNMNGARIRTYQAAINLIKTREIQPGHLITHSFTIEDYEKAINTALDKKRNKSMKVIFTF